MKKYVLLLNILPFWSGMSRRKIVGAQISQLFGVFSGVLVFAGILKSRLESAVIFRS